jgi:hypothetical protein
MTTTASSKDSLDRTQMYSSASQVSLNRSPSHAGASSGRSRIIRQRVPVALSHLLKRHVLLPEMLKDIKQDLPAAFQECRSKGIAWTGVFPVHSGLPEGAGSHQFPQDTLALLP